MDLPASLVQQYRPPGARRLTLYLIVLLHLVRHTWTQEYTTVSGLTPQGPCRDRIPCKAGSVQGDPGDCSVYYECPPARDQLIQKVCPPDTNFDRRLKKCVVGDGVKCTRPCKNKPATPVPPEMAEPSSTTPVPNPGPDPKLEAEGKPLPGPDNELDKPLQPVDPVQPEDTTEVVVVPDAEQEQTTVSPAVPDRSPTPAVPQQPNNSSTAAPPAAETTTEQVQTTTARKMAETTAEPVKETTKDTPAPTPAPTPEPTPKPTPAHTPSPQPPYVIVTEAPEGTTQGNITGIGPGGQTQGGLSKGTIGIIAGVAGGIVLLAVIIIIIVFLIRRRKQKKDSKIIRMENPEYVRSHPSREQNFRFSRDSTLYVGPTVNLQNNFNGLTVMNNNSPASDRKKRLAPPPPGSTGSASPNSTLGRSKRQAPPPPNPFTGTLQEDDDDDLYEKDSHGSSVELTTFTAKNQHASLAADDKGEPEPEMDLEEEESSAITDPLMRNGNTGAATEPLTSSSSSEDEEEVESPPADPERSLLNNKYSRSKDNMSVDSYDIDKNPFFEG